MVIVTNQYLFIVHITDMDETLSKTKFVTFVHQAKESINSSGTMKSLMASVKFFW